MKKTTAFVALLLVILASSCSSKPSDSAIKKKILLEYVCAETAKVHGLKIIRTEKTETIIGNTAWRYTVSGEVEWPQGCREFGTGVQPGAKEAFEKTVVLAKNDDGDWQ